MGISLVLMEKDRGLPEVPKRRDIDNYIRQSHLSVRYNYCIADFVLKLRST